MSRDGQRRRGRWCWVRVAPLPDNHEPVPHVGYAVGRGVGNAVTRNRIRRRLRHIVTAMGGSLPPGLYLVGVHGPDAATIAHAALREDLEPLLLPSIND